MAKYSLFVVNNSGWTYCRALSPTHSDNIFFGAGVTEFDDDALFTELISNPSVVQQCDEGIISLSDGVSHWAKKHNTDQFLIAPEKLDVDIVDADGVPFAQFDKKRRRSVYPKSGEKSGLKAQRTTFAHAHGSQQQEMIKNDSKVSNTPIQAFPGVSEDNGGIQSL